MQVLYSDLHRGSWKLQEAEKEKANYDFETNSDTIYEDETEQDDNNDKLEKNVNERNDNDVNKTFSNTSQDTSSEPSFKC